MRDTMIEFTGLSERDMIVGLLGNFYILDYGFVSKVNADGTVNVTHAKRQQTIEGVKLPETRTTNLEVLTLCGAGFSIQWDVQPGDQVLLLGLKDYIPQVAKVTQSTDQATFIHYTRDTMKALPLSIFNKDARVTFKVDKGTLQIDTEKNVELNGNTSHLVTYEELAQAINTFMTALNSHTHPISWTGSSGSGTSSAPTTPMSFDISASKAGKVTTKAGEGE